MFFIAIVYRLAVRSERPMTASEQIDRPPRTSGIGRVLPATARCRSYRHRLLFLAYLPFAAPRAADSLIADRQRTRPPPARPDPLRTSGIPKSGQRGSN